MDYWNKVPVPTFPKEVLATRIENEEKLAAVQIMIPTKDSSHAQWHFSDFPAWFSHSCERDSTRADVTFPEQDQ